MTCAAQHIAQHVLSHWTCHRSLCYRAASITTTFACGHYIGLMMALIGRIKREKALQLHEEIVVDNFSAIDCDLTFFSLVRGLAMRHNVKKVLDYGAGRNQYEQDFDPESRSYLLRDLRDLRFNGAEVTAVD